MHGNDIILVQNILISTNGSAHKVIEEFRRKECLFEYPLPSAALGIFLVSKLSGKI